MSFSRMARLLLSALLLWIPLHCPVLAQEPPVPEWIKNLKPTDYILLNQDSTGALPFHIQGNPAIEVTVRAHGITLPDGTTQEQREFLMIAQEDVVGDKLLETQARGKTMRWRPTWQISVMMFETPEVAALVLKDRWGDTYGMEPLTDKALGDPRLVGQGVACPSGELVRYQNLIWHVVNRTVEEVRPEGGRPPMDSDIWYANEGLAQVQAHKLIPALAKRWLDKVAKPLGADLAIVDVELSWKGVDFANLKGAPCREARADQQWVSAQVQNQSVAAGAQVTAQNVMLQFYVQLEGEATRQKLGDPLKIADALPPYQMAGGAVIWDLKGKPVENATVTVECYVPNEPDPQPQNNLRSETVSIWFAQNAEGRPFTWGEDTYSFGNTGFQEQELEETIEGMLALLLNNVQEPPQPKAVLHTLLFPPTFQRLKKYVDSNMGAGVGGHCYGMSATAAVYFEDPGSKPVAKPVKDMTLAEARTNINIYHRAQLSTIFGALMTNQDVSRPGVSLGTVATQNVIAQHLRAGKLCTIVEFFSPPAAANRYGHAVLAYKLVSFQHGAPLVYAYDPNWPQPRVHPRDAMSQMRLWGNDFRCPDYMNYRTWAGGGDIMAARPFRTISLDTVNHLMPSLKKILTEMIGWLNTAQKVMGIVKCPADAVFTDQAGRRVGMVGGKPVNEIPGAEIRTTGAVEIYVLPAGGQYSLTVTGTGAGTVNVDLLRAVDATTGGVISFQKLPIAAGVSVQGQVAPGGQLDSLTSQGKNYTATLAGTYDLKTLPTSATAGPGGSTQTFRSDLVVCQKVVNNQPEGVADSFPQASELAAFWNYTNLAQATFVTGVWKREGKEILRKQQQVSAGNGWVWFSIKDNAGLKSGRWTVELSGPQGLLAQRSFTIGVPPVPAGTPTTAPAAEGPVLTLTGPSSSIAGPTAYPVDDGRIRLSLNWTKPGVILDTVGINGAANGDFQLRLDANGVLTWQIYHPSKNSSVKISNGWHILNATRAVPKGEWHEVIVTFGQRGMGIRLDGQSVGGVQAVLPLSGRPMWIGDYPGDDGWGTNYNIHPAMTGQIRGLVVEK